MKGLPRLDVADSRAWRSWLERHHDSSNGVWLVFYKVGPRSEHGLTYSEALDEALCFGWIDSIVKRENEETYVRKLTPRTNAKNWSAVNLRRARALIRSGRMTEAGRRVLGVRVDSRPSAPRPQARGSADTPAFILAALARRPRAAVRFAGLAPGYRKRYLGWILSAKQETTRQRRLAEALDLIERGVKSLLK